jgi:hypothetical protein
MGRYQGQGNVGYTPGREYWIEDFLPPKIQAYVYRWLYPLNEVQDDLPYYFGDPKSRDFREKKQPKSALFMNCWTLLLDIYRDIGMPMEKQSGKFFYVTAATADSLFKANAVSGGQTEGQDSNILFRQLSAFSGADQASARNTGRSFGDLLYIKTPVQKDGPAHVAMWIDDDLYFEKTNFSSNDPIRLAFFEQVIEPYQAQQSDQAESQPEFMFLKQKLNNNPDGSDPAIPHPESAYANRYPNMNFLLPYIKEDGINEQSITEKLNELGSSKKYYYLTLETGSGGAATNYGLASHRQFELVRNSETGRAELNGANDVQRIARERILCRSDLNHTAMEGSNLKYPYVYQLTVKGELEVMSAGNGRLIASLPRIVIPDEQASIAIGGSIVNKEESYNIINLAGVEETIVGENRLVFVGSPDESGAPRFLKIFEDKVSNSTSYLHHPNVLAKPIRLQCSGDVQAVTSRMN